MGARKEEPGFSSVRALEARQQEAEVRGRASGHHQPAREHLLGVAVRGRGRQGGKHSFLTSMSIIHRSSLLILSIIEVLFASLFFFY